MVAASATKRTSSISIANRPSQLSKTLRDRSATTLGHCARQSFERSALASCCGRFSMKPYITVERIQRETALHYGIGLEKLLGDNPNQKCSRPRHVAMYLARRI